MNLLNFIAEEYEHEERHRIAQYNASLPIEDGGLGLSKDNTSIDRAKALGFDVGTKLYHGTTNDFNVFHNSSRQKSYFTDKAEIAEIYANAVGRHKALTTINASPNIIPVYTKATKELVIDDVEDGNHGWSYDKLKKALKTDEKRGLYDVAGKQGYDRVVIKNMMDLGDDNQTQYIVPNSSHIRSVHAAFDPLKKESDDILA